MSGDDSKKKVLIISTDLSTRSRLKENLMLQKYLVFEANSQADALHILDKDSIDIAFLDFEQMQSIEMDLVSFIHTRHNAEIVVLTSLNELDEATQAMRNGASFYLVKPIKWADFKGVLDKLTARIEQKQDQFELEQRFLSDLMAGSPAMQKVLKYAMKIAPTSSTVLVGGESGTGKEFFARIIHRMSKRFEGRFVATNCGAIPDALFESEMFGHRKGAFTGADREKSGIVEEAHMGTLFLDEVGELSPPAQVKLLRFLQEREFRRIGETTQRSVDIRVIAASNRDLHQLVHQGLFREDLYYRLNIFNLYLPPLRERKETLPNLIRIFVHKNNQLFDKKINTISKSAEAILANYDYPGNVRELENIIEHAIVLADGNEITETDFPEYLFRNRLLIPGPKPLDTGTTSDILTLADIERNHIKFVLDLTSHNYTDASKKLGISRSTLWRKIKEYNIQMS